MKKQNKFILHFMTDPTSRNPRIPTMANRKRLENDSSQVKQQFNPKDRKFVSAASTNNDMVFEISDDSPIKTESLDDWNEEHKDSRYRHDCGRSENRDRRTSSKSSRHERSRSHDRRERPRSRDRRGRSNSRDRRGRSNSRDRRGRSRSRDRRGRSRSRDRRRRSKNLERRRRSRSRDCRGISKSRYRQRSKSLEKCKHDFGDRSQRSEYRRSDRNIHDYIDKRHSRVDDQYNLSIDRVLSWECNGIRTIDNEFNREGIDRLGYDSGNSQTFQLANLNNKPSSTVTSSSIQKSDVQFNDTFQELSKNEAATKVLKYQHTCGAYVKVENDRVEAIHNQKQMEKKINNNSLQSAFLSQPTNPMTRNPFATHPMQNHIVPMSTGQVSSPAKYLPYQNYSRNVNDYRFSINNNVGPPNYQQSISTNAPTIYGRYEHNVQVTPTTSNGNLSKSHLDNVYRSGNYSIPSLFSINTSSNMKFKIPKKKPTSTVTQDTRATGNYSRAASEIQPSNVRGGYDSAAMQYESKGNINQRANEKATIDNNISKKSSPTEIQPSIVTASSTSSVLPNVQSTAKKNDAVESILKTLVNPSGLLALINLCEKFTDAVKTNENIQRLSTQPNPPDTGVQNDISLLTTTKAEEEKIKTVKKSKRKRMIWASCRRSRKNSRKTKNDANNGVPPLIKKDDIKQETKLKVNTKAKLEPEAVKPKRTHEPTSTVSYNVRLCRNTPVSYVTQSEPESSETESSERESPKKPRRVPKTNKQIVPDDVPARRVNLPRATKRCDDSLYNIKSESDSEEEHSSSTKSSTPKRRRFRENRKRPVRKVVPELKSATPCRTLRTKVNENRTQFTSADVKPKSEPSAIKNNNSEWHSLNPKLECLHCNKNTGISLANHYVTKHPDCEVFPCRLSPDIADYLRNTTEVHKSERLMQGYKLPYEFRQRCYFFDKYKLYTRNLWQQHISVHTGCYEFRCKYCAGTFSAPKKDHDCGYSNDCVRKFKYPPFHRPDGIVYGYVCDLCNFVRFEQNEIEKHLQCEHEGKVDDKFRKLVLMTFPIRKKKHEIRAEEEALKLANTNIEVPIENKPLVVDDDNDIAVVIKTDEDDPIDQKRPKQEVIDVDTEGTVDNPITILDSDDSEWDEAWVSCTDEDENDDTSTDLQPSTSTKLGDAEKLPEIIPQVKKVTVKKEPGSQTTASLCGTSQQQNEVVPSTTQSPREAVQNANIEENITDAATMYKNIVQEAIQSDNDVANIIAPNIPSLLSFSSTMNAASNSQSENGNSTTESLNDPILSNVVEDVVDMSEFNLKTNVQTDSDQLTTVQQSNIQSPEIPLAPSTCHVTSFLKISNVASLQCSSSQMPSEFATADISNEIFTDEEMIGLIDEMIGSPNTGASFSNIFDEFDTLSDQQSMATQKTTTMQEIVELPEKRSKLSTTQTLWNNIQHEIDDAAYNLTNGTGLVGSDLYRCCVAGCLEKYTDNSALQVHISNHEQSQIKLKCYHCPVLCKTIASLMHHIETHGNHRYFCGYCLFSNTTLYNVWHHMQNVHDQIAINTIPLNPKKTNDKSDHFVVFPTGLKEEEWLISFASRLVERYKQTLFF